MSAQGVKLASEHQMRVLSKGIVGDNLVGEEVPLAQPLRLGVDLMLAPFVPDLVEKNFQLLDQNDRSETPNNPFYTCTTCIYIFVYRTNQLTHNGAISGSEIWVKVGGDRGSDTVKVSFQLNNPNSVTNMCFLCI